MSRELDERVARAMGWVRSPYVSPLKRFDPANDPVWRRGNEEIYALPHYSYDIAAARSIEDWLEVNHPKLRNDYALALYATTHRVWQSGVCRGWAMAYATPEQRCRAFLVTVKGA